jgi:hypothetical protein
VSRIVRVVSPELTRVVVICGFEIFLGT